ncbi:MAG: succinyl-diaminopimelate desuccinylase [Myxococcaceae bacterium]|nr:succinyl-diaminopimelate desuccinylase [Myxococcaceae bacterium]
MKSDALAARALELLRIPSVIGAEAAIADHCEAWARRVFAPGEVRRISNSLVLGRLDDPRPSVALVGHLDTVPAPSAPNPPRLEGGRLFGLGSSDMKGALAVMMGLAETLPRERLPVNLVLVLYAREEGPYADNELGPVMAQVPQLSKLALGIAMEPTDGAVHLGCVGTLHATLTFEGKSAHSARPWQGKNAIHAAGTLLAELDGRARVEVVQQDLAFYEVMSATLASGGRARNVVPERFELNLNYRFAPGKSLERAQDEVRALVAGRAAVHFTDLSPSGRVCLDNPWCQALVKRTGLAPLAKQAWTDVARFSVAGVDAVNFGPGETAQAHQAGESAPVEALETSFAVLRDVLSTPLTR